MCSGFLGCPVFGGPTPDQEGKTLGETTKHQKTHAAPNTTQTSPTHSETGPVFCGGGGDNLPTCTFMCGRTHPLGMVLPAPDTHVCAFSLLHRGLLRALLLQATPAQVLPLFSLSPNPGPFFGPRLRRAERSTPLGASQLLLRLLRARRRLNLKPSLNNLTSTMAYTSRLVRVQKLLELPLQIRLQMPAAPGSWPPSSESVFKSLRRLAHGRKAARRQAAGRVVRGRKAARGQGAP